MTLSCAPAQPAQPVEAILGSKFIPNRNICAIKVLMLTLLQYVDTGQFDICGCKFYFTCFEIMYVKAQGLILLNTVHTTPVSGVYSEAKAKGVGVDGQ